ncbi:spermidine sinapoyl-CoA acyltransferase-like [Impatiens glandulifera]|uniref:spermidine sinapoyl-CoA acyltransferase-like n=1 Tax=Impatiens glandulifera TaxID=253017 RepID=UPI001FB18933|nr:spermidine sinapoyl-CoA acyltransferase-like [Impatiens glandulifera]
MAVAHEPMNPNFHFQRKEPILVKPSEPIPSQTLSLSTLDNEYFVENHTYTLYVYRPRTNPDHTLCSDPASVIKQGLAKALNFYYPLAGKIKRHPDRNLRITFDAEDNGVPFVEASVDKDLISVNYMDGVGSSVAKEFVLCEPINREEPYNPLRIQVTVFSCGGFVLGMSLSHSVCDGFGAAQLFKALVELAGGKTEPSVIPVWERERLTVKILDADLEVDMTQPIPNVLDLGVSPHFPTLELMNECVGISGDGLKRLKMKIATEMGDEGSSLTTLEAITAYVWRSRFRALELSPDDKTMMFMTMGLRNLPEINLPKGYYGNAFIVTSPIVVLGRDLNEGPLSNIVKLIKESKHISSQHEYIQRYLRITETNRLKNEMKIFESMGGIFSLSDWRRLNLFEEEDFGWGGCSNVVPLPYNVVGHNDLSVFLPPYNLDHSMKDGLRIFIGLPKVSMKKFKQEINVLHNPSYV